MTRGFAFLSTVVIAALLPAIPAMAQEAAPPPPPPSRVFSLPPGNPVDRPPPEPEAQGPRGEDQRAPRVIRPGGQLQAQQPSQQPTQQATPPRIPAPQQATPNSPTQSVPQRQAPSVPAPRQVPGDGAIGAPPTTQVAPTGNLPEISDEDLFADPGYDGAAPDTGAATAVETPEEPGGFAWWWIALAGAIVAIGGYVFLRRRQGEAILASGPGAVVAERSTPDAKPEKPHYVPPAVPAADRPSRPVEPTPELEPAPATASPFVSTRIPEAVPQSPTPPRVDLNDSRPVRVQLDFQPIEARMADDGLSIVYRVILENVSNEQLSDIAIDIFIRSADASAAETLPPQPLRAFAQKQLAARSRLEHRGEIRLAPHGFQPMQSNGKAMIVPVVDLLPRYRDGVGKLHEVHLAMLIGRENDPPTERMAPFWLDGKQGKIAPIGCRPLAQNVLHDEAA